MEAVKPAVQANVWVFPEGVFAPPGVLILGVSKFEAHGGGTHVGLSHPLELQVATPEPEGVPIKHVNEKIILFCCIHL